MLLSLHECECKDDGKGDVPDSLGELPEGPLTSESDSTIAVTDEPAQKPGHGHGHGSVTFMSEVDMDMEMHN